jgi:SDR family mycofactocin-dependent oxidoreductase
MNMSPLDGKVAFITGVARGQGRAHALRLSSEGVRIIGVDICANIPSMNINTAKLADLEETQRLVEAQGGQILARQGDVRDFQSLQDVVAEGVAEFGRLDIVLANAGIVRLGSEEDLVAEWADIVAVNLTGVYHTVRAALPAMIDGDRGGSIIMTGSTAAVRGASSAVAGGLAYTASKRGLVGLMQMLARDLAKHWIRVNIIHPTGVRTPILLNSAMKQWFESGEASGMQNALPIEILQPEDIANVVAWLVSDDAKYITGVELPVDAGFSIR